MEVKLDFETVRERWLAAGGKDTGGIIGWFAPPVVEHWVESEIPADEVAELRFIGAEGGGRWAAVTDGSNRVGDLRGLKSTVGFHWDPAWLLIAVRDSESGERVLIDGNERASQLQLAVATRCNCARGDRVSHHRRPQPTGRPDRQGAVLRGFCRAL